MKVSLKWLQTYFDAPLPSAHELADALTFHAFEIEEETDTMLDVKVLPNRSADCLSHRGIAKEISAILNLPLNHDPLREPVPEYAATVSPSILLHVQNERTCTRYSAALVQGVKVGPSPAWLKEALETVGQRSINNVVDATNYVMLDIGQPLHAFDAKKLGEKDGRRALGVRAAREGEEFTSLTGERYTLTPAVSLIVDGAHDVPLALAGIKGGKAAELTTETTDLIIESANFDGTTTRRSAQLLRLWTEASMRFQNRPSPELVGYGMRDVLALIQEVAGGEVVGLADTYPTKQPTIEPVVTSREHVNGRLGTEYTDQDIESVFTRLDLSFVRLSVSETQEGGLWAVTPPFERTDLTIPEDLVEEVGRIMGYDTLPPTELPPIVGKPDQNRYRGIERIKDQLVEQGFIEVSTQSFAKKGDITLANPLDVAFPALRASLEENLVAALAKAKYVAPLVLEPKQKPKLFEIGTVFPKEGEHVELRMTEQALDRGEFATDDVLRDEKLIAFGTDYAPKQYELGAFTPYSAYPFITRDVSCWVLGKTGAEKELEHVIRDNAGKLLIRLSQTDVYPAHAIEDSKISYTYRLVFQSYDRTLTDGEVNAIMEQIYTALRNEEYDIR